VRPRAGWFQSSAGHGPGPGRQRGADMTKQPGMGCQILAVAAIGGVVVAVIAVIVIVVKLIS